VDALSEGTVHGVMNIRSPGGGSFTGGMTGQAIMDSEYREVDSNGQLGYRYAATGAGSPTPYDHNQLTGARMSLNLNLTNCTYNVYAYVEVPVQDEFGDPLTAIAGILQTGVMPLGNSPTLLLQGNGIFPVYSTNYIITMPGVENWFQTRWSDTIVEGNGEGATAASGSWSVVPITSTVSTR
jgi:hypothetical protein